MWIIFPRFDSNNFLEIVFEILKINTTFYLVRVHVTTESNDIYYVPDNGMFNHQSRRNLAQSSKNSIRRKNLLSSGMVGPSHNQLDKQLFKLYKCNKFTYRAISYGNKKETSILYYSSDISDIMAVVKERYM